VPGCPPRPDAIILGVAKAAEILANRAANKIPVEPVVMALAGSECGEACACAATPDADKVAVPAANEVKP
jgi:NADH:ubiquinone oxidoreductase subunit B-like Fe-S oxidoreductase